MACTNWLGPNLGARNDLVSVFHQTLTLCEGAGSTRLAVVTTAAGDSSTQRGSGTGKSLGWENVVSPSNQVTAMVSTTNKHAHISFYGTTIGFARTCVSAQN